MPWKATDTARLYQSRVVRQALRLPAGCRGRSRVVLDREVAGREIAGAVAALARNQSDRAVRGAVRHRGTAGEARGRVRTVDGEGDGVVVPAVRVGGPSRRGGGDDRSRLVVLETEAEPAAEVPRLVGTAARDRCRAAVRAAVGGVRAGVDAGGLVGAGERDRDRMVVPAVQVRAAPRLRASDDGGGPVVLEADGQRDADVAGIVGAGPGQPIE